MLQAALLCCLLGAFAFLSTGAEDHVDSHGHAGVRLDKNMVQDKEHIMEHLEGVIEKSESEMSPQELQLHYFKMHDYDGNNLLDGLELATAISHVHKEVLASSWMPALSSPALPCALDLPRPGCSSAVFPPLHVKEGNASFQDGSAF